jgi:integrase
MFEHLHATISEGQVFSAPSGGSYFRKQLPQHIELGIEPTTTAECIRQRIYRGVIDSPKTEQSFRKAALSEGLLREIEDWRKLAPSTAANAWVFPSERMTPLAKENVWRRSIGPKLQKAGFGWVNFQVMRRTHASLMSDLGVEGKLVANQLGHSLDVNQNVYTQSVVSKRQIAGNRLENSLNGVHCSGRSCN